MMKIRTILFVAIVLFISGCASASKIEKVSESKSHFEGVAYEGRDFYISDEFIEGEQYRVFHQASTGFSGTGGSGAVRRIGRSVSARRKGKP